MQGISGRSIYEIFILQWYCQQFYRSFSNEGAELIAVRLLDSGNSSTRQSCPGKCKQTVCPRCIRIKVMLCIHLWQTPWLCFSTVFFSIWKLTSHQMPGLSNQSPPHMPFQAPNLGQWVFMQFFYTGMKGRYWWTKLVLAKQTGSQLTLRLIRVRKSIGFSHAKCWLPSGRAYPPELSCPWLPGRAFHSPGKKGRPVNQAFPGLKVVLSPSGSSSSTQDHVWLCRHCPKERALGGS